MRREQEEKKKENSKKFQAVEKWFQKILKKQFNHKGIVIMSSYEYDIQILVDRVRNSILSKGPNTIRGLARIFRKLDSFDGNNKVDRDEFFIGLRQAGLQLTKQENLLLHSYFDKNRDGSVDFNEFLLIIRGELNERRKAVVLQAFNKFDSDHSGFISTRDLRGVYNCSKHPKVVNGQMTEEQVFLEFLQNFCDTNKDGKIDINEWISYYSAVSVSIENDEHFEQLLKTAWGV